MKSGFMIKLLMVFLVSLLLPGVLGGEDAVLDGAAAGGGLTAEFVDADVRDVIRTLGRLAGLNLVITEEVTGKVSISLREVGFEDAVRAIMEIKGLDYEEVGGIMRIAPFDEVRKRRELAEEVSPLETKVFVLRYTNAKKVESIIKEFLSERGSFSIYHRSIRGGWPVIGIGEGERRMGAVARAEIAESEFPTMAVVRDTASRIRVIGDIIDALDTKPKQVLIEAVIAEIRYDDRREIGINWETLTGLGAEGEGQFIIGGGREVGLDLKTGEVSPPEPGFTGLGVTYTRLKGLRVEAVIRALELEGRATVLSSPRTLVLDGHEATVLVGLKHPIFETTLVGDIDPRLSESISHYEPIGVLLRVVPAVWEDDIVNISIHPAVTALGDEVVGTTGIRAREIVTQEVDTNLTIRSGDTVVIGGLIKDDMEFRHHGVPFLSHVPVLGFFFRREREVKSRQELVIFITPTVLDEAGLTPEEEAGLREHRKALEGDR